jgi:hypothetical protein
MPGWQAFVRMWRQERRCPLLEVCVGLLAKEPKLCGNELCRLCSWSTAQGVLCPLVRTRHNNIGVAIYHVHVLDR